MLVLHGAMLGRQLVVWGEMDFDTSRGPKRKRPPHPFGAPFDVLSDGEAVFGLASFRGKTALPFDSAVDGRTRGGHKSRTFALVNAFTGASA